MQTVHGVLQQQTALFCVIVRVKESFIYTKAKEKKKNIIYRMKTKLPTKLQDRNIASLSM